MGEFKGRPADLTRGWLVGEQRDADLEQDTAQLTDHFRQTGRQSRATPISSIHSPYISRIQGHALNLSGSLAGVVAALCALLQSRLRRLDPQGVPSFRTLGGFLGTGRNPAEVVVALLLAIIVTLGIVVAPGRIGGGAGNGGQNEQSQEVADLYSRADGGSALSDRGERHVQYDDKDLEALFAAEGRLRQAIQQAAESRSSAQATPQKGEADSKAQATETAGPNPSPTLRTEPQHRSAVQTYEVQPGDTVSEIAANFGVSTDTILWANGLDEEAVIDIGDELVIPPTTGVIYTVAEGDTLSEIAGAFGISSQDVAQFNGLDNPDSVMVGMMLVLPGAEIVEAPAPEPTAAPPAQVAVAPAQQPAASAPQPAQPAASKPAATQPPKQSQPAAPVPAKPAPQPADTRPGDVGQRIAQIGLSFIGTPYVWGGTSPAGFDCSGLVYYAHKQVGISIPRTAETQAYAGPRISREDLKPGDVVVFQNTFRAGISHVGIYVGNGQFVHAVTFGVPVKVDSLDQPYYAQRWWGAVRLW